MKTVEELHKRLSYYQKCLQDWQEPDGFLVPTEPDPDARHQVRENLQVGIEILQWVLQGVVIPPSGGKFTVTLPENKEPRFRPGQRAVKVFDINGRKSVTLVTIYQVFNGLVRCEHDETLQYDAVTGKEISPRLPGCSSEIIPFDGDE